MVAGNKPLIDNRRIIALCKRTAEASPLVKFFLMGLCLLIISVTGCGEREITEPTPQMDIERRFWVRVLLFDNAEQLLLDCQSNFIVETEGNTSNYKPLEEPVKLIPGPNGIRIGNTAFNGGNFTLRPGAPHIFELNGRRYRGELHITVGKNLKTLTAINHLPLEPYLAGVIAAEMPPYWETAALKAQAVAARTYCLYTKRRFGKNRKWDVTRTQANQVYSGLAVESARTWRAVNQTKGMVLTTADGKVFPTYYSSVCGGHTESSQNVFGKSFEPLHGVHCPWCRKVAKPGFFFWRRTTVKKEDAHKNLMEKYSALGELGKIEKIEPTRKSAYENFERITLIKLTGENGKTDTLRAEDFRLTIDPTGTKIRSTAFDFSETENGYSFLNGRGYGHAVGMCQCGAEGMGRAGKTARHILDFYYPGAKTKQLY